jgi:hypothetical protein
MRITSSGLKPASTQQLECPVIRVSCNLPEILGVGTDY